MLKCYGLTCPLFRYFYSRYPLTVYLESINRISVKNVSVSDVFINLWVDNSKITKYNNW